MTNITWQYIAGFFDGEGTIFYTNSWAKNRNDGKRTIKCKRLVVSVVQGLPQKKVILEIGKFLKKQKIGFTFVKTIKYIPYLRLDIGIRGNQIYFLEKILPYIIVKKKKAIEGLKFLKSRKNKGVFTQREIEIIFKMKKEKKSYKEIGEIIKRHPGNIAHCVNNIKKKNYV